MSKTIWRVASVIIGIFLVAAGGVTFMATTLPGVALIVYGLVGKFKFLN